MLQRGVAMYNYLCEIFGIDSVSIFEIELDNLPIYMRRYEFKGISLFGKKLIFMKPYKLDIPAFKKHSSVIYEKFNCMTVLVLERSKEVVRRNLIDNHLMFIEKNKYIYLPYAGIVFNEVDSYGKDDIKELTYKDFIVSTSFVYLNNANLTLNDICGFLFFNKMTVSRTMKKLETLGLIKVKTSNKKFVYSLSVSKSDFIECLLKYMKSPIRIVKLIDKNDLPINALYAGVTAISKNTILSEESVDTFAVSKEEFSEIENLCLDYEEGIIIPKHCVKLEVWNYNPNIKSINNCAELISVIKTINDYDERIIQAINDIKGLIINE